MLTITFPDLFQSTSQVGTHRVSIGDVDLQTAVLDNDE
jgi:hypothetical protein